MSIVPQNEAIRRNEEFFMLVMDGKLKKAEPLLGQGADINFRANEAVQQMFKDHVKVGETLLHVAIRENLNTRVKWLISKGCDLDPISPGGLTPLFYTNKYSIFKLLQQANILYRNDKGESFLEFAISIGPCGFSYLQDDYQAIQTAYTQGYLAREGGVDYTKRDKTIRKALRAWLPSVLDGIVLGYLPARPPENLRDLVSAAAIQKVLALAPSKHFPQWNQGILSWWKDDLNSLEKFRCMEDVHPLALEIINQEISALHAKQKRLARKIQVEETIQLKKKSKTLR